MSKAPQTSCHAGNAPTRAARYEYISLKPLTAPDALSDFIAACEITVKCLGWQYGSRCTTSCPRINGDMELIYVVSGESIVTINGETFHGFAGDMLVIPQYAYSYIDTNPDDPHENYWMHIKTRNITYAEKLRMLLGGPLLHIGADRLLLKMYRWLDAEYSLRDNGFKIGIDALVKLIFIRIIRITGRNLSDLGSALRSESRNSNARQLLSQCVREITARRGALSASDLSRITFASPAYIRRIFNDMLGMPPSEFIRSTRMREAEIMLRTSDEPVSSIAAALGFSSLYHFSREFRRIHSMPPTTYRSMGAASDRDALC